MDGDFYVTKRINSLYILFFILVFISCRSGQFCDNTVSVWNFHDEMSTKTSLKTFGDIPILPLHGTDLKASKVRGGDGFVAKFGKGYFDAGQGVNGILNLSGKSISILVRVKANRITGFTPILSKSGNDQSVAYSIALNPVDNDVWIETLMGSDEIAGAHLLKCKMSKEDITKWHDIILRFDGHISQLYVDGELRDDEVTVGSIRNWNAHPLIIGTADNKSMNSKGVFDGEIDYVALFNRCLSDNEIMTFGEAESIKPNKSVQSVLFNGELVGWLYSSYKNFLSPIEEAFWSINLIKEKANKVSSKNDESEDVGFYQVNLRLSDTQQYVDLYLIAKKIHYSKRKRRGKDR